MRLGAAYSYRQWVLIWIVLVALLHGIFLIRHQLGEARLPADEATKAKLAPAGLGELQGDGPSLAQSGSDMDQARRRGHFPLETLDPTVSPVGKHRAFPSLILLVATLT